MSRILIAEDEARIATFLDKGLRAHGFAPEIATTGDDALRLARTGRYELLILDIGLPGSDGFEVLRTLRGEGSSLPIIILTARDSVHDTVAGLEGGADDYITKPFRFEELLARVRIRLRTPHSTEDTLLTAGDAALNLRTRQVHFAGNAIDLSAREFALAETFFRHPGQILTRGAQAPGPV